MMLPDMPCLDQLARVNVRHVPQLDVRCPLDTRDEEAKRKAGKDHFHRKATGRLHGLLVLALLEDELGKVLSELDDRTRRINTLGRARSKHTRLQICCSGPATPRLWL